MESTKEEDLRKFITDALRARGDRKSFVDGDSLFLSGRLDSLSMMMMVVHLESTFGIDFSEVDFDVELIDSLSDIISFVDKDTVNRS